ncbi:general transcription factor II-I repeat domain-containing protein 2-like [Rhopalosiphum maidis]|uniref:general transcription factor II-I repeat domain-containing protein 2-like n=1 Tax=Rhopalosiphum maidis TaxID=43146 RepID=UPI000F00625A|nr:general transcription factor II-I repeat domain-containing protein 2-like [Rhopalosiphum maidis]XP_026821833.1 general transcription factor II-I repeat domain-containing protein 2-like [Rhopalosiphum maidis]
MKEYNVRRHYDNEHKAKFENLTGELRQNKIKHFLTSLSSQQNIFKSQNTRNEASVRASYVVAEMLAKNNRPFTDIEFFKKCMLAVTNEVCPEKIKLFEEISLSTRTYVRRTEELGNNLFSQLKDIIPSLDCFSIAIDESTDISDTAQLLIFIRGMDKEFNIYEELADMCSIKGTTTGEDIFKNIENSFEKLGLSLKKFISITTDGGKNMSGIHKGFVGRIKTKMIDKKF